MNPSASILLENSKGKLLLFLRDDIPTIKFPNMWCLLGGGIEDGETPEQAIRREMLEEIELDLGEIELFRAYDWQNNWQETIFYKRIDIDIDITPLHEGQEIRYFSKEELLSMDLAYFDNQVMQDFFNVKL